MAKMIMRPVILALVPLMAVVMATAASAGVAHPNSVVTTSEIVNQAHGLCLDAVESGDGTNGDPVQLWQCHGTANQEWNLNSNGTITNTAHGLCLDAVRSGDQSNGDPVQLFGCNGGSNQGWDIAAGLDADSYIFNSATNSLVLDAVASHDGSDGDKIQLWNQIQLAGPDGVWIMSG